MTYSAHAPESNRAACCSRSVNMHMHMHMHICACARSCCARPRGAGRERCVGCRRDRRATRATRESRLRVVCCPVRAVSQSPEFFNEQSALGKRGVGATCQTLALPGAANAFKEASARAPAVGGREAEAARHRQPSRGSWC